MRISTSVMTNMASGATSNSYSTYMNILSKILSGKNFTSVSEDVPGATKVLKLNDQLAKLNEYQSNINAATNEMNLAYDTLNSVNDELTDINSLIIEAANATTTPEGAKAISSEIKEKVSTIVSQMNTKYMDNYIFSGTNTQSQTYKVDENGDTIYQGSSKDAQARNLTISEGKTFAYNVSGDAIFGEINGDDFFSQMKELDTLLNTEPLDYDAIREKMTVIEGVQDNIIQTTGDITAKVSKLDATQGINDTTILNLTEDKAEIEEVDLAKMATELASARNALQASYTISAEILQGVSLLDYI